MQAAANAFQDSMGPIETVVHPEYKVYLGCIHDTNRA
jgi:hypothetical protein